MSNWNDLKQIIESDEREINFVESMNVGGVYIPLAILNEWDVYVFTHNKDIHSVYTYLIRNGANFKGIIYFDKKFDNCMYEQINIKEIKKPEKSLVVIIAGEELELRRFGIRARLNIFKRNQVEKKRNKIQNRLIDNGINKWVYMDTEELLEVFCECGLEYYHEEGEYYKENINGLKYTYEILEDELSKDILIEWLRTRMQSGTFSMPICDGRDKYFSGYSKQGIKENLYLHKEDEVWINCGSSLGDTIIMYFANGYKAKKVYAYEGGNDLVFNELKKNIALLPSDLSKKVELVNCFISNDTKWNKVIKEKITLVNADIEGAEISLIYTMKDIFVEDRPVIALCVYHRKEHIIEIPKILSEFLNDYVYILRKYPCTIKSPRRTSEFVLYAIPRERYINN